MYIYPVKRITGIFVLSVYLLSFAEVHNLFKIPVLFQHFQEHKQEDPSISFWDFIKIHYMEPIVVDEDYDRDQQLPFRNADCCLVAASSVCECNTITVEIEPLPVLAEKFYSFNEVNKARKYSFAVFQPPRYA